MDIRKVMLDNRRRLATVVLLVGGACIAMQIWDDIPRPTEIELALGELHGQVVEVRLMYLQNGIEQRGASFAFPGGAPAILRHRADLSRGRHEVSIELRLKSGRIQNVAKPLLIPADGVIRIQAF
jgi:hypothetical protein